jgi:hypothetical protein
LKPLLELHKQALCSTTNYDHYPEPNTHYEDQEFLLGIEIKSPICFPILIPSTSTWRNIEHEQKNRFPPSQGNQKNSLNQETNRPINPTEDGESPAQPIPTKKRNTIS